MEYDCFLLGPGIFSGAMLVSGSVSIVAKSPKQIKQTICPKRKLDHLPFATNFSLAKSQFWGSVFLPEQSQKPGCSGYIGSYTIQLCGDCNKRIPIKQPGFNGR